jgi:hypothetical protein
MQDANGKKDSASHQEAPEAMCKASEDVGKPSKETQESNELTHYASFTNKPSAFR